MDQKKDIIIVLGMAFAALLCLLISVKNPSLESKYVVKKEAQRFSYGCASLNCALSEEYELEEGENIEITLVRMGGRFDILVDDENGDHIYEGNDMDTGDYEVTVPKKGIYHLVVSGEKAQGCLSFQMKE